MEVKGKSQIMAGLVHATVKLLDLFLFSEKQLRMIEAMVFPVVMYGCES